MSPALSSLRDYSVDQQLLLHLVKLNHKYQITFAYNDMSLCDHVRFLNPPIIRVIDQNRMINNGLNESCLCFKNLLPQSFRKSAR